jgi:RNA polymerase sigma-70 factor, ECF subfamily
VGTVFVPLRGVLNANSEVKPDPFLRKGGRMMRMHNANTCEGRPIPFPLPYEGGGREGFRETHTKSGASPPEVSQRQHVDFTGVKAPPLLILWKAQARAALKEPRVNDGKKLMSNTDTRVSIIVGVCQRDPERWREFDAIYRPMLSAFLRKQHLNESDAEELVQEIFVKLLDKIQTYDRERIRFRSWLFAVAHNALVDKARRRASFKKAIGGWVAHVLRSTASDSTKLAEQWVKHHREKILAHALETVRGHTSAKAWACFEQRLLRARPASEIARELGIEPGAVHVNAHRVLKKVRAVCQKFDEELTDDDDAGLSRRD